MARPARITRRQPHLPPRRALTGNGDARAVTEGTYEPETTRFGGPDAMDAAHRLFAADSRRLLDHLAGNSPRLLREIPVILAARLLRAARQDWYEQGDCWEQMAAHRHDGHGPALEPDAGTVSAMLALLSAGGDAPGSPVHDRPEWASAFEDAGRRIAALAGRGALARGQRAVLAQHLLFLFNRHGVSASDQHLLAAAACQAVFGSQPHAGTPLNFGGPPRSAATVSAVTATTTDSTDENRAALLRNQLADWISGRGTFQTPGVERAFRTVSRHEFLPGHPLEDAYSRNPVVTQRAPDGSSTSSASSPNLVAQMLEQLRAEPGNTVLEIGAATGFNAALLASLTGPGGKVVTIEYDPGLAGQAAANLRRAGYHQVQVIAGDGALGHQEQGPYDRIIVTAEATDITAAWWDQLNPADGRIVVPVRLHGSGLTRSLGLRRTGTDTMAADSAYVCGFVAMRGSGEQAEQQIRLDAGAALKVDAADQPDPAALSGVLHAPAGPALDGDPRARRRARSAPRPVAPHHDRPGPRRGCLLRPTVGHPGRPQQRSRRPGPALGWSRAVPRRRARLDYRPAGRRRHQGTRNRRPRAWCSRARRDRARPPRRMGCPAPCRAGHHRHPRARRTRNCTRRGPGGAARHDVHHRLVAGVAAPLAAGYRYAPGGLAARRFPLAPRPKPPCRPLTERLARVARLAG